MSQSDIELEQGSPGWLAARCGSLGASSIEGLMAKSRKKGEESAGRKNLRTRLVLERITGKPLTTFKTAAMEQGNELEDDARRLYAFTQGVSVEQVGLVQHATIEHAHASPDSLVGDDGGLEIKCPEPSAHKDTLMGAKVKRGYVLQMQWGMACTGRKWWDFVSYNPDFPPEMQLHVERFYRDSAQIVEIETQARLMMVETQKEIAELTEKFKGEMAA